MAKLKIPNTHIGGSSEQLGILTSPLNKLWRAKILLNRATSGMEQNPGYSRDRLKESPKQVEQRRQSNEDVLRNSGPKVNLMPATKLDIKNDIVIINPNTSPPTSIVVQGKPSQVDVSSESTWATVKSMGRNNPFMIYTGGEDTISFDISWFAQDSHREDVITKCKLLQAWSKADGYSSSPPTLLISWGSSKMFDDDEFVLTSANYVLSNFQNACRTNARNSTNPIYQDLGLLPNHATQTLVFKRVTFINRGHQDMVSSEKIKKTTGINNS
ncbi:MAG: hypothetical protein RSC49_01085 [Clostridium sp.]